MFNASRSASSPDPHPAATKVRTRRAAAAKFKPVNDPPPVERDRDLDAACELLAEARHEQKVAAQHVKSARAALAAELLAKKVGRYDHVIAGVRYSAELVLADPDVKLRQMGEEPRS